MIYSGRSQSLVDGLVERFEEQTGIDVEVRYGSDAQLIAALEEEGEQSPADLFWANTTGALGAASNAGLLTAMPDSLLQQPDAYAPSSGLWAPATVRFRVLAYNPEAVDAETLPASVMDLPGMEQFEGRVGWTPSYSSFQDFVTAMRLTVGEEETRAWIEGMKELDPKAYPSNTPMLQALTAGEIDIALTNHYYVLRITEGDDADAAASIATHHFEAGDVGNLALVTGAGLLATNDRSEAAQAFVSYLLADETAGYVAEQAYEYPVVSLDALPAYMLSTDEAVQLSPDFDFEQLRDLEATLALLRDAELL